MTTTASRRAILAGAAAVATGTANAGAIVFACAEPTPDAELLELGKGLDAIIGEWRTQYLIDARHRAAWEQACIRAGLPRRKPEDFPTIEEWRAHGDKRSEIDAGDGYHEEVDDDGRTVVWVSIHERMYPLIDDILSLRATSIAGLGVQARAASLYFEDLWEPQDADPAGIAQRAFIEAVCAFCGVVPVMSEEARAGGLASAVSS